MGMKRVPLERTPNSITKEIINACHKVVPLSIPFFVKKVKYENSRINKCSYNTKDYAENYGGKTVFGWEVNVWRNVLVHFIGHAIVKHDEKYICVTPTLYGNEKILFLEDKTLQFDYSDSNSRMPFRMIPMNESEMVKRFIELEYKISEIKCTYPIESETLVVHGNDAILLKALEGEKETLTKRIVSFYKY